MRASPRRCLLIVVVCCLAALLGCSAPTPSPSPDPRVARSQALLALQVTRDDGPGCAAAVGERGALLWLGARGLADLEAGTPLDDRTTFEIASVSKGFTALAVLLLERSGRLSRSDALAAHVKGLPSWAERVTLTQLVQHTSGIPEYFPPRTGGDPTAVVGRAEVLRQIAAMRRLDFEPGSRWAYSNSNYVLLAEVVESVSGQPYPELLRAQVFDPLGLTMVASAGGPTAGLATPYEQTASGFEPAGWGFYALGAVGVRATAADLVRWADDYRTGAVGGEALTAYAWDRAPLSPLESARYGPGIFRLPDGTLFSDGDFGNYRSGLLVSPDRQRSAVLVCNRRAGIVPYEFARSIAVVWDFR